MDVLNTNNLKQYFLILLIIVLAVVLGMELFAFFPGMLGACTLYILMREPYFHLTIVRGWKKWIAAVVFILLAILIFVIPLLLLLEMLLPKLNYVISNAGQLNGGIDTINRKIREFAPQFTINETELRSLLQRLTSSVPGLLGATANVFTNLILAFFLLYFMLVEGRRMERSIQNFLPLKPQNLNNIWEATRTMVVSNAIGIPVLAACQAIVASIGYYFFDIEEYILWGVVTGVFSLVPIVGTAIIWVPLSVYLWATGNTGSGLGLMLYSVAIITNIDNVLRFTILKRLGDVHPIITVLGIIVGVPLFGFMGFIFGPLLISYFLLLIRIYRVEFSPAGRSGQAS